MSMSLTADAVRSVTMNVTSDGDCAVRLDCWSDGNPAASHSWIEWTSRRRTTGRVYSVECHASDDAESDLSLQCLANNSVGQRPYVAASSNLSLTLTAACCRT